ncbi:MAG: hypothetical protein M0030_07545, partial [Actinomycetota bacterium]|nr:hypothetical protein [Actinomycetota bacterium]
MTKHDSTAGNSRPGHRQLVTVRLPGRAQPPGAGPPVRALRDPRLHGNLVPAQTWPPGRSAAVSGSAAHRSGPGLPDRTRLAAPAP